MSVTLNVSALKTRESTSDPWQGTVVKSDAILDAGTITYDGTETYTAGTVGEELNSQRNTLNKLEVLVVTIPTSVTIGTTYTSTQVAAIADVEDDMVVLQSVLGTPSAQTADWTVATGTGSITITSAQTGTASTSLTLYLMKSR